MKAQQQTLTYLKTLGLQGITNGLDEIINDADSERVSYLAFLNSLLASEIDFRIKRRVERNMTAAHFPVVKTLENFDFGRVKGIGRSEAANLVDCRWVDMRENLLFFGPPGIGETHPGDRLRTGNCRKRIQGLFRGGHQPDQAPKNR